MIRVGLTGGIASGKSQVSRLLAEHGAFVIDSDVIAREVVAPGTPGLADIVAEFGPVVLTADGALDRTAMGAIVFDDPQARHRLEQIVHPRVRARAAELEAVATDGGRPPQVVVHDIPLLVETGQADRFDIVVVVEADEETQVARLAGRGMSRAEAKARISAQARAEERLAVADHVIRNDGTLADLRAAVNRLWGSLTG